VIGGGVVARTRRGWPLASVRKSASWTDRCRDCGSSTKLFGGRVRTRFSTIDAIEQEVFAADVVIGAVLVPGASAPKLVTGRC